MATQRTLFLALAAVAVLVLLWLLLPVGFRSNQPAPTPAASRPVLTPAGRAELEKFQGTWEFVSLEVEGDKRPESEFKKYTVAFQGDQWIVSEGTNVAARTTIVVDPTSRPKSIDAFPPPGKGQPIHGIYQLEVDKLTICNRGEDNGERPDDFSTEPNSGLVLIVYKRVPR